MLVTYLDTLLDTSFFFVVSKIYTMYPSIEDVRKYNRD